jgi:dUTP pyrophosphatase|nr:MAG TPA: dUTPase [Caudoviricetes sp.]
MKLRIKYLEGATKMQKITKGNWIDVYAYQDTFVPEGERAMINLGFSLELPQGWEGHLAPRSSTFKTWGVIQTNHVGVVDDTYIGDNDIWHMPVYCLQGKELEYNPRDVAENEGVIWATEEEVDNGIIARCSIRVSGQLVEVSKLIQKGTWIRKGDKIGQFRIMETMPKIEFEEVESFGNTDRGGFGSTGTK